jgi:hypothetical protein
LNKFFQDIVRKLWIVRDREELARTITRTAKRIMFARKRIENPRVRLFIKVGEYAICILERKTFRKRVQVCNVEWEQRV